MDATQPDVLNAFTPPSADAWSRPLRVAVVVQRYGPEVNGGAEVHARQFVENVRDVHTVTVLTTRARDYNLWDDFYPEGLSTVDGTPVLRFAHPRRGHSGRARVPRRHLVRYRLGGLLTRMGLQRVALPSGEATLDGPQFLERQGPYSTGLMQHLAAAAEHYDVVVFFTALYHPAAAGLLVTPVPRVLVPTLHDERAMYHPMFRAVFARPNWILWNCEAERRLATKLYGPGVAPGSVCGVGIASAPPDPGLRAQALQRLAIPGPYFIYVGRISRSKGFGALARAFARYAARSGADTKLVVLGQGFMDSLPQHPHIVYAGFVSDAERDALISGALATVVTSRHESLSLVTLESLVMGTPVIVNGRSDVLRAHVEESGGGYVYSLTEPLSGALSRMAALDELARQAMGQRGRAYVQRQYDWPRVRQAWLDALARVTAGTPRTAPLSAETQGA